MPTRALSLAFISFASVSQAANIVLVTDFADTRDVPFISRLTAAGHSVEAPNLRYRNLDATKIAELNAADLVIVSRNTDSSSYANNPAETAVWDGITTTIWLGNAYLVRDSRWQWVTSSGIGGYSGDVTAPTVGAGSHPLYDSLTPAASLGFAGESKYLFTTGTDVENGNNNLAGNGTVLGVRNNAGAQHIIAAEFSAGGTTGSGNTLGGDRFYFALPVDFANHNANGLQMIDNSVAYLVPEPSSAMMALLGVAGFVLRRRRS